MTTSELHKILDDKNRKISVPELKKIIDYLIKHNGFQIVLDLEKHLKSTKKEN